MKQIELDANSIFNCDEIYWILFQGEWLLEGNQILNI